MKVIRLTEPYSKEDIVKEDIVLALGFFDGVHLGHQKVLHTAYQIAQKQHKKMAVMTFDKHPKIIYQKLDKNKVKYLTTLKRKLELFKSFGTDISYVVDFDEKFFRLSPLDFVNKYIVGLNASVVVAGLDYTYGKPDIANMSLLPNYAKGRFEIIGVDLKKIEGKIGTTMIKAKINQGKIQQANKLLGYPYQTTGTVVHGYKRGRTLGFPTLNIETTNDEFIPKVGVYAVKVKVFDKWFDGMASIGHNSTFGSNFDLTVEINLFEFNDFIYGEKVNIQWFKYLRKMVKFNNAKELVDQLKKDKVCAKKYLSIK